MQVACSEHLNLPSFATLKHKPGEMSVKTFSPVPTGDYAFWFISEGFFYFFFCLFVFLWFFFCLAFLVK